MNIEDWVIHLYKVKWYNAEPFSGKFSLEKLFKKRIISKIGLSACFGLFVVHSSNAVAQSFQRQICIRIAKLFWLSIMARGRGSR